MNIELLSSPFCPYAERVAIVLHEKGVEFDDISIDLAHKPDRLRALSPRGKVPVLVVDGIAVVESQPICELLDELFPEPPLRAGDPFHRAHDRAWFAIASGDILGALRRLTRTDDPATLEAAEALLVERFRFLDESLRGREWLSGDGSRFGLADVAMAPVACRMYTLAQPGIWEPPKDLRALRVWGGRIMQRTSVQAALAPEFETAYLDRAKDQGGLLFQRQSG